MQNQPNTDSKAILLGIAECGGSRPHYSTSLYTRLKSCTNKKNKQYDGDFDNKIRKLRPDWFLPRSYKSKIKKNKLLILAKNNKPRPNHRNKLYGEFCSYTNKKNKSYDDKFTKKIKKIRPDWFLTRSDVAAINKGKILSLKKKPKRPAKLAIALKNYICTSSQAYDPRFKKLVFKLKPNWFKK